MNLFGMQKALSELDDHDCLAAAVLVLQFQANLQSSINHFKEKKKNVYIHCVAFNTSATKDCQV